MKAYYDGSEGTDQNGDKWITLAGIIATDAVWADFDGKWSQMLRSRYPVAPYIHMIELLAHDDPFETVVGWESCKIESLIKDILVVLSHMQKAAVRMSWSSINESARLRLSQVIRICAASRTA